MHCESSFSFNYTTPGDVSKLISKLKTNNSAGHDRMSTKLLQKIRSSLSPALSLIINQSVFTVISPDSLKIAKILPIFKKGDPSYFGNYGPISLLSAISKVFVKAIFIEIYEYFNSNNLLYKSQYGFRANHSTELAGVRRYFDPHDILTPGSKYRNDILTPPYDISTSPLIINDKVLFYFYFHLIRYII